MLEFAILGLLHEAPMHGYELRKRLFDMLGTLRAFSYGSLYPTLRRLLKAGLIVEDTEKEVVDDRTARSWGKRAKRVYKLTAEGKERFAEMLADVGPAGLRRRGLRRAHGVLLPHAGRGQDAHPRGPPQARVEERREGLRSSDGAGG